jgi:putative ABC transport system permease protein
VAKQIDALFANSDMPTKTESELSEQRAWASWSAAVVTAINIGSGLILAILVLVLANSMAMATRESTREFAAMRAIGFRARHITALVLAQGSLVTGLGITIGLCLAPAALDLFTKLLEEGLGGAWPLALSTPVTLVAAAVALVTGLVASAWPAWRSGHLPVVDALRRVA